MYLLYVDALGMKARWRTGDIANVQDGYRAFEAQVSRAVRETTLVGAVVSGGVQSDAAAIVFDEAVDAVRAGRRLFDNCLRAGDLESRLWVRGLIRSTPTAELTTDRDLGDGLFARHFAPAMLEAINVETSFKGPRLLIEAASVTDELRRALAVPVGDRAVIPLRSLNYAPGPRWGGDWQDVLYLVPEEVSNQSLRQIDELISERMRWACSDPAEHEQVAMLTVVWAETKAIMLAYGLRNGVLTHQSLDEA